MSSRPTEKAWGGTTPNPAGPFIKIGIGVLRKDDGNYDHYKLYEVVDPGKWSVRKGGDFVEFTQELADPSSGYGYTYRKTVRLTKGAAGDGAGAQPEEHRAPRHPERRL